MRRGCCLLVFSLGSYPLSACPAFLEAQTPPLHQLLGHKRSALRLYSFEQGAQRWHEIPLQIDPRREDGRLLFFEHERWQGEPLDKFDRLAVRPEHFGSLKGPGAPWPCQAEQAYELSDLAHPEQRAYLLACRSAPTARKPHPSPLSYTAASGVLFSHHYLYQFKPDNHMLFSQIALTEPSLNQGAQGQPAAVKRQVAAYASDILIFAALRRLVDLRFSAGDIISQIERTSVGPLGMNARVSFYLKILFLKLKLSLSTDVSFYADAAHIPMVLYLPSAASAYLKPESGIFYGWTLGQGMQAKPLRLQLPSLHPENALRLLEPNSPLQREAKTYCPSAIDQACHFQYDATSPASLTMQLRLPQELVGKGFYPLFVADPQAVSQKLGWGLQKPADAGSGSRQGLFFPTAGLAAGAHAWDFWLRLRRGANTDATTCPRPLTIKRL